MDVLALAARKKEDWFFLEIGAAGAKSHYPLEGIAVPYVENEDTMALYYSAADAFVSTSLSESFGLTVCEAQACGTPCVAFAVGGLTEIIDSEKSGYLLPIGDVAGVYNRIKAILDSPRLAGQMASNARTRAETMFSATKMGDSYLQLYKEILQKNQSRLDR